jgi:uncharacterized protein YukE
MSDSSTYDYAAIEGLVSEAMQISGRLDELSQTNMGHASFVESETIGDTNVAFQEKHQTITTATTDNNTHIQVLATKVQGASDTTRGTDVRSAGMFA